MCRIAGFWDFNYKGEYDIEKIIILMRDTLEYGGPDDAGVYIQKDSGLALGNRRLSILDLSSLGKQPMSDEKGDLWITYNGEVYNFQDIRNELLDKGYGFKSNTDTEVVLKAYKQWGLSAIDKFRGMFAFCIWDNKNEKIVLCRDRVGVKPLYWYYKDGLFMFASELKAFHKHPKFHKEIDKRALSTFLTLGYIPSPHSIFNHTHKLEPGHFLIIDKNINIKKIKYWDVGDYYLQGDKLKNNGFWSKKSEIEIIEEFEQILKESFKLRMIADVPVGIFLSGGTDSSIVTALLAKQGFKLKTFTIGFYESSYNEAEYAKKIANFFATQHTEVYCTAKQAFDVIPKLPEFYDEPFGDVSSIPTHLVSMLAKQRVKSSLSADGGDELFCGYPWYQTVSARAAIMKKLPFLRLLRHTLRPLSPDSVTYFYKVFEFMLPEYSNFRDKYIKLLNFLGSETLNDIYFLAISFFLQEEIEELMLPEVYKESFNINNINNLHTMMCIDFKTYLSDDLLTKVDRVSMAVALESREPFLDNKIIEYAARLPLSYKYRGGKSKYILREILYKYIPKKMFERPKQGFGVPIHEWFQKDLKQLFLEYLNENRIKKENIFNPKIIITLLDNYLKDKRVNVHKLWFLLMFEMWKERWHN